MVKVFLCNFKLLVAKLQGSGFAVVQAELSALTKPCCGPGFDSFGALSWAWHITTSDRGWEMEQTWESSQ